jgi:hypothetical protein
MEEYYACSLTAREAVPEWPVLETVAYPKNPTPTINAGWLVDHLTKPPQPITSFLRTAHLTQAITDSMRNFRPGLG